MSFLQNKVHPLTVFIFIAVCFFLFWFLRFENDALSISKYEIKSSELPAAFDGYRIVQISDLHNKEFGSDQIDLAQAVRAAEPDLIVFTGDIVDSPRYNHRIDKSLQFLEKATKIAPVYFVSGNHDWWSGRFLKIAGEIEKTGTKVLRNEEVRIVRDGRAIRVIGVDDPDAVGMPNIVDRLDAVFKDDDGENFSVLLSHRPELFPIYADRFVGLTFTGHAHGGLVRLPFMGGLFAPNQGFFPKYSGGVYQLGGSKMVVSRGLGGCTFCQRIFNRPEVVVVTLRASRR